MKYNIISSSSSGNCIILEDCIMLDIGVSYKKVMPYLDNIKLIFISHEHQDHLLKTTVKQIAFNYPQIKFCVHSELTQILLYCGVMKKNILIVEHRILYNLGLCKVKTDYLVHDVPNTCFMIEYKSKKCLYAVDTSSIDHIIAKNFDLYLIEGNYLTDEEIDKKIAKADEEGVFTYLRRVKKTHLSQLQALNWLQANMGANSEYCFIHQHIEKERQENENYNKQKI